MKAAHMKTKIVIPALVGMMMIPGSAVYAADQKAEVYPVCGCRNRNSSNRLL